MTFEIALVFLILGAAVILFVTEWVRVDVVALLVLVSLAVTSLVEPRQALSGFSNPAVVTVWAVFILSGGLARTGVASQLGRWMLRLAGTGELRLITLIMLTAGILSAVMNNVGVAALLLPVVMDLARRTDIPPSKLLIPLSFSCLLGGLTTLIGTPPNILVADALRERGLPPFEMFDYAPVGGAVLLGGIVFMALVGRHLLPARGTRTQPSINGDLRSTYRVGEDLSFIHLASDSTLNGKTLAESRLGSVLGLNVIGIFRAGAPILAPAPHTQLRAGDRLLVEGTLDQLSELRERQYLSFQDEQLAVDRLVSSKVEVVEVRFVAASPLLGQTLREMEFRKRFGVIVLAIRHKGVVRRTHLEDLPVQREDVLLVQGSKEQLEALREAPQLRIETPADPDAYRLEERLMVAHVPEGSPLAGRTLIESRLGDALGFGVLGIVRGGETDLLPDPHARIEVGDTLLIKGQDKDLAAVRGLRSLEIGRETTPDLGELESDRVGLAEVVLSPRATCAGRTLRELHFREKYGLGVIAIARGGTVHRTELRDMALRFGDALLLHGPREKLTLLAGEPDFLVLTEEAQKPMRLSRAPAALAIMAAVVLSVVAGLLPIYIAAVAGAVAMVLTGCLTMDDAYRAIEWKAVFLIAGMLPLGIALQQSGGARFVTENVIALIGGGSPLALAAGIYVVTAIGAQIMPTSAVAILMAPIALNTAADLELSPFALLMTVALGASASFMSPVAHPANVLVMGPGGYKFRDYTRVGLPMTLICLVIVLVVLPLVWPLRG